MFKYAPEAKCTCGNKLSFPNGWYPEYFVCNNCGKVFDFRKDVDVEFPNVDLNLPFEELAQEFKSTCMSAGEKKGKEDN
jgi:hypothetical protein